MHIENISPAKIDIKTTNGNLKHYLALWGLIEEDRGKKKRVDIDVLELEVGSWELES